MAFPFVRLSLLALPLIEIAVFVVVGSQIGALATVALVVATTILGAVLLRVQGFGVMTRIRAAMEAGDTPGRDLVHGVMIVAAGLLLIIPGFVTDAIGLLLFIPPVRDLAWRLAGVRIVVASPMGATDPRNPFRRPRDSRTIDLDDDEYAREGGHDDAAERTPRSLEDRR